MASIETSVNLTDNVSSKLETMIRNFDRLELAYEDIDGNNLTAPVETVNRLGGAVNSLAECAEKASAAVDRFTNSVRGLNGAITSTDLNKLKIICEVNPCIEKAAVNFTNLSNALKQTLNPMNSFQNSYKRFMASLQQSGNNYNNGLKNLISLSRNLNPEHFNAVSRSFEFLFTRIRNATPEIGRLVNALMKLSVNATKANSSIRYLASAIRSLNAHGLATTSVSFNRMGTAATNAGRKAQSGLRSATNGSKMLNSSIRDNIHAFDTLAKTIRRSTTALLAFKGIDVMLKVSDETANTKARLDLMNDGLQTTDELYDKIYRSAQNARGSMSDMSKLVTRIGITAGDAFGSADEIIKFGNLLQKTFAISGTTGQQAASAMLQLTQALGAGVLQGDELRSIRENAPMILDYIAKEMNVAKGELKKLGSEGKITSDIIRKSFFAAADEIESKFQKLPRTWEQTCTVMKNAFTKMSEGLSKKLNDFINSDEFESVLWGVLRVVNLLINGVSNLVDMIQNGLGKALDIWEEYRVAIMGVVFAVSVLVTVMLVFKSVMMIVNFVMALNPVTWLILAFGLLIVVVYMLMAAFINWMGVSASVTGTICGGVMLIIGFFWELLACVFSVASGIGAAMFACADNIRIFFSNSIQNIKAGFWSLLSMVTNVILGICEAWNNSVGKLPLVPSIDTSGIKATGSKFDQNAQNTLDAKEDYHDITDSFMFGYDLVGGGFNEGWMDGWFGKGYNFGSSFENGITGALDGLGGIGNPFDMPFDPKSGLEGLQNGLNNIGGNTGGTNKNTGKIAKELNATDEQLKYLRDIAERDVINKFTTAEIKVDMPVNATIKNDMDLDGIINHLQYELNTAMAACAEGVHY